MPHLCIVYPHIPWLTPTLPSSLGEKPLVVSLNMHAFSSTPQFSHAALSRHKAHLHVLAGLLLALHTVLGASWGPGLYLLCSQMPAHRWQETGPQYPYEVTESG